MKIDKMRHKINQSKYKIFAFLKVWRKLAESQNSGFLAHLYLPDMKWVVVWELDSSARAIGLVVLFDFDMEW